MRILHDMLAKKSAAGGSPQGWVVERCSFGPRVRGATRILMAPVALAVPHELNVRLLRLDSRCAALLYHRVAFASDCQSSRREPLGAKNVKRQKHN